MITSPWRSTKWDDPTTSPSRPVIAGELQRTTIAIAHSTHWTSPPNAPPRTINAAPARLNLAIRRISRVAPP